MEEQTDQVAYRMDHVDHVDHAVQVDPMVKVDQLETPDQDLLMRIEEQISTQVAKTESDDESGDDVMVTCGKLIISSPDTEESEDKRLHEVIKEEEEKHFALKCIEKVDDEGFEAVFEINSDIDEIGLSESDIKALELIESREEIVLRDKSEEPPQDDFSSSVLKFQDAIENYTKSVFTGISDTITEIEKAKSVADEQFSEKLTQVEDKYFGRVPVIEEPFEEVKTYTCGDSNENTVADDRLSEKLTLVEDKYAGRVPVIEEPFEEVKTYICGDSNDNNVSDDKLSEKLTLGRVPVVEEPFEEVKAYICGDSNDKKEDEYSGRLPIIEEPLEEVRTYLDEGSDDKLEISDLSPESEEPFEEIKFSHVHDSNVSDSENVDIGHEATKEEKDVDNSNVVLDKDCPDAVIAEENTRDKTEDLDEPIIKLSDIPKLLDLETVADGTVGEIQSTFEQDSLSHDEINQTNRVLENVKESVDDVTKIEERNPVNNPLDENKDKIDKDINIIPVPEYSETLLVEQNDQTRESEKEEKVEILVVPSENCNENEEKVSENQRSNNVEENVVASCNTDGFGKTIPDENSELEENLQSEQIKNKGIQRNAESRKSKKNIKITRPQITEENTNKCSANKSEDMALLLNMILLIALGIFLYLICGETPSLNQEDDDDSLIRIPAHVSGVVDGYVQLSTLAEMELRK